VEDLVRYMNRSEPIIQNEFYHVYNRGNRRQPVFRDERDYRAFLTKLAEGAAKHGVILGPYCLMPNHYHLILQPTPGGSLPMLMAAVATSAAKRYNLKYGEVGHLFQGPYKYKHVARESLAVVARYIHLNPVSAGLVKRPEDWPYSDFRSLVEGYLQPGHPSDEGNLLLSSTGLSRDAYIAFLRESQPEGYLQPENSPEEGNLLPGLHSP